MIDCPISLTDLKPAEDIIGKNKGYFHSKAVWSNPNQVHATYININKHLIDRYQ